MALFILNGPYQSFTGSSVQLADGVTAELNTAAPATGPQLHTIPASSTISGVLLIPDPEVTREFNEVGANGVQTLLQYSFKSPSTAGGTSYLNVMERIGAFAYLPQLVSAENQEANDANSLGSNLPVSIQQEIDSSVATLLTAPDGGSAEGAIVAQQLGGFQRELSNAGYSRLASDIGQIINIASEWNTPVYYYGTAFSAGAPPASITVNPVPELALVFGIELTTVHGAESTWAVQPGASSISADGYTLVSHADSGTDTWSFDALDADTDGQLEPSATGWQAAVWTLSGTNVSGGGDVGVNAGPGWRTAGTGDFNHDGHPDILWQNANGQASIWEMNGANQIPGGSALVGPNPGPSWRVVGTGDFNDDGHSDILWQNADGQASIWEMNATNQISGGSALVGPNPGPSWRVVGTGDFNDDGHSDILWQNADGQASIWEMNGTNQISGGSALVGPNPGPSWRVVGTGDFNGDGHSDILWQNANGQASIWEMNGTNVIDAALVGPNPGPSWKVVGTGDFNGDGHSDILWQNVNGQVSVWELNGTNVIGSGLVGSNPGPIWQAIAAGGSEVVFQNTIGA